MVITFQLSDRSPFGRGSFLILLLLAMAPRVTRRGHTAGLIGMWNKMAAEEEPKSVRFTDISEDQNEGESFALHLLPFRFDS